MALEQRSWKPTQAAGKLLAYAQEKAIIDPVDARWAYNRVLECCALTGNAAADGADVPLTPADPSAPDFEQWLDVLAQAAIARGQAEDTAAGRDRICMRVMGALMPRPSEVARLFEDLLRGQGPQAANDWFYGLSCDVDYVRKSAIARNVRWTVPSRWGDIEITINKSKPEKDPRDIAAAGAAVVGDKYPACALCMENEGYSGRPAAVAGGHAARQNLRIVPIRLGDEPWGLQYSPYAYYNEHCIAMSSQHRPMHVDRASLSCLLDFVDLLPHYFIGSNADLPIVGGSILSHDHFQGGRHEFAMARAQVAKPFPLPGYPGVQAGILQWPLTVIRLDSTDRQQVLDAAVHVLDVWRGYSDEPLGIRAQDPDGTRHNTVTPICRRRGDLYELDLALRCNVTTEDHPLGLFHPHEDKWHVKKENIGLIEVMGLAILPPRLEAQMDQGRLTKEEIGRVFVGVLEDAGVYKWDEAGRAGLDRFLDVL